MITSPSMTTKTPAVINSNTNKLIMVNMTVVETILNMKSKIKTTMTTMMIEFLFLFSTFILFYSFFFPFPSVFFSLFFHPYFISFPAIFHLFVCSHSPMPCLLEPCQGGGCCDLGHIAYLAVAQPR